jgi:hypothetical protein
MTGLIPGRQRIFPVVSASRLVSGSPNLLSIGYKGSFPEGKAWPGHDADN